MNARQDAAIAPLGPGAIPAKVAPQRLALGLQLQQGGFDRVLGKCDSIREFAHGNGSAGFHPTGYNRIRIIDKRNAFRCGPENVVVANDGGSAPGCAQLVKKLLPFRNRRESNECEQSVVNLVARSEEHTSELQSLR